MSWWTRARTFVQETVAEMRKVSYPSRDEVVGTTVVVLVASVIFALYLWLADLAIVRVYNTILGLFAS